MRTWSKDSQEVYDELDTRLQRVVTRVRDEIGDISLLEGFRNEELQNKQFDNGTSTLRWPDGLHNKQPALAVDFRQYPWPGSQELQWAGLAYLASAAILIAKDEGVTLRWGGDWNRDGNMVGQDFYDLFHLEIVEASHDEIPTDDTCSLPSGAWRLHD